ncbi:MAG: septum formation initiator [Sulfurospirillaceae bacterium]|nr:septum formation initiator [Sulfurospirillaceae bacterium]MDD2826878.1 septum formation initiator [Sulfurospirillaceae bacterium]
MSNVLDNFDEENEEGGEDRALFYLKVISLIIIVLGFGLYIGDVLFGKSSLDVLLNLQEDKDTLSAKIQSLKEENAVLQKEFFELRQLDPDRRK